MGNGCRSRSSRAEPAGDSGAFHERGNICFGFTGRLPRELKRGWNASALPVNAMPSARVVVAPRETAGKTRRASAAGVDAVGRPITR